MRILLTNDDGIYAEGINVLRKSLDPHHELYTIAPEREMSATGHAITLHKPLRVEEVQCKGRGPCWAVNGTPSDCVKIGVEAILEISPDVVVSGINRGSNLGNDIFYSGTVSAALEGYFHGYPAIAVSLAVGYEEADFTYAAECILDLLGSIGHKIIEDKLLLNINVPSLPVEEIRGVQITRLAKRSYLNVFDQRVDPRGRTYYWMAGEVAEDDEEGTDSAAIKNGYVSITPLTMNLTNDQAMHVLRKYSL